MTTLSRFFAVVLVLLAVTPDLPAAFGVAAYLKASNTGASDALGRSVAISGNTMVVGAPYESSSAVGANGNGADNSAEGSGAAYVYVYNGTNWIQQSYLKASNTQSNDNFGWSVAISGDTIIVGALNEDSNGSQINNSITDSGAAYIFVRTGTNWTQQAYLKASNPGVFDNFGVSVAVSGDTAVVGAYQESSNATGVNGNQANDLIPSSGAAYVFTRSGTVWSQQAYLKASNTGTNDYFGYAVAIDSNTIIVGAVAESSSAAGVNGDQSDNSTPNAGAAYVFTRSGTTWSQQAYLKASNPDADDLFGISAAISGDTIIVGSIYEASAATGVNGGQFNNNAPQSGAAYVFVRSGTLWSQQAYLKASNTGTNDSFGYATAIAGDRIVVGAYQESSNAKSINGDQANNLAIHSGAAYVFTRSGTAWSQQYYLKASNTDPNDNFGFGVAVTTDLIAVGAPSESSSAVGINGSQTNNAAAGSGAVYIFAELPPPQLPLLSIVPAGYFLRFTNAPGTTFYLQRAPTVTGPYTNFATITVPPSGFVEFHDATPPPGQSFYKLSQP